MAGSKFNRRIKAAATIGLGGLLGINTGCPLPGVVPSALKATVRDVTYHQVDERGMPKPICEEDARVAGGIPVLSFTIDDAHLELFGANSATVQFLKDGVVTHDDIGFKGEIRFSDLDGNNTFETGTLYITDKEGVPADGAKIEARIVAGTNVTLAPPMGGFPPYTFPGIHLAGNMITGIAMNYVDCNPNGNDWREGDGICDSAYGEPADSIDCIAPECTSCPDPEPCESECVIGDRGCYDINTIERCVDNGEGCGIWVQDTCAPDHFCDEDANCTFNPDSSQKRAWTSINYADASIDIADNPPGPLGEPLDMFKDTDGYTNKYKALTYIATDLEDFLVEPIASVSIEEHGYKPENPGDPDDCSYISRIEETTRVGEVSDAQGITYGVWSTPFDVTRSSNCASWNQPEETLWAGTTMNGYDTDPNDVVADTRKARLVE